MFGTGFSHIRFGLGAHDTNISVKAYVRERMHNVSGFGEDIWFSTAVREGIDVGCILTPATPFAASLKEALSCVLKFDVFLLLGGNLLETMGQRGALAKDIGSSFSFGEQIANAIYLSKDIETADRLLETPHAIIWLSKDMYNVLSLSEMMGALISTAILERETITLRGITIPPGATLSIDTELFVLLLNNQNAIHYHSGDWPTLNRGLVSVDIDTGVTGRLEGQLLFRERYL